MKHQLSSQVVVKPVVSWEVPAGFTPVIILETSQNPAGFAPQAPGENRLRKNCALLDLQQNPA